MIFVAQLGDKTMLATITLAKKSCIATTASFVSMVTDLTRRSEPQSRRESSWSTKQDGNESHVSCSASYY